VRESWQIPLKAGLEQALDLSRNVSEQAKKGFGQQPDKKTLPPTNSQQKGLIQPSHAEVVPLAINDHQGHCHA
jgi:hypothetical protein